MSGFVYRYLAQKPDIYRCRAAPTITCSGFTLIFFGTVHDILSKQMLQIYEDPQHYLNVDQNIVDTLGTEFLSEYSDEILTVDADMAEQSEIMRKLRICS